MQQAADLVAQEKHSVNGARSSSGSKAGQPHAASSGVAKVPSGGIAECARVASKVKIYSYPGLLVSLMVPLQ